MSASHLDQPSRVADYSIRLRILKGLIPGPFPGPLPGCRLLDPIADTERRDLFRGVGWCGGCRLLDPIADTER